MKKILFVCTGNTCRSCMAQAIFNDIVTKNSQLASQYTAVSAGISACIGEPASNNSVQALKMLFDIDLASHSACQISHNTLEEVFLVLTMTRSHKEVLLSTFPQMASKIYTLKAFANDASFDPSPPLSRDSSDITDPYGMPLSKYLVCANEIKALVDRVIEKLLKL